MKVHRLVVVLLAMSAICSFAADLEGKGQDVDTRLQSYRQEFEKMSVEEREDFFIRFAASIFGEVKEPERVNVFPANGRGYALISLANDGIVTEGQHFFLVISPLSARPITSSSFLDFKAQQMAARHAGVQVLDSLKALAQEEESTSAYSTRKAVKNVFKSVVDQSVSTLMEQGSYRLNYDGNFAVASVFSFTTPPAEDIEALVEEETVDVFAEEATADGGLEVILEDEELLESLEGEVLKAF